MSDPDMAPLPDDPTVDQVLGYVKDRAKHRCIGEPASWEETLAHEVIDLRRRNLCLVAALRVAKNNLDNGTYSEAAKDIIASALWAAKDGR